MSHRKEKRARRAAQVHSSCMPALRGTKLSTSLASLSLLFATVPALAQENPSGDSQQADDRDSDVELIEVVVSGIRQSEQAAIDLKRKASSIQDSISAQDIGKLPDATISDSLQRITGVQINRSGGEGSSINIRGLPQVGAFLNGEAFLTTGSIVSVQPNFTDIPSQLFAGADVIKAPTADLLNGGITGTVNLRTHRPEDFGQSWSVVTAVGATYGDNSELWRPEVNGLAVYNADRWGVLLSAAYSDITLNNSTDGMAQYGGKIFGENSKSALSGDGFIGAFGSAAIPDSIRQLGGGNVDVDGDGLANSAFYGSQNFTDLRTQLQRKRLGLNGSVQGDLGRGFKVTADWFYTDQKQFSRMNGYQLNSSSWLGATFEPVQATNTGVKVGGPYNDSQDTWNQTLFTTQVYNKWLGDMETYSENDVTDATSRNYNLQLDFNNDGNFTGGLRALHANANELLMQSYVQFANTNGAQWPNDPVDAAAAGTYIYPGGNRVFNANGFAPNTLPVTVDMRGEHIAVTMPQELQTFLADQNNYALKTISSEGNHDRESSITAYRADGHYKFGDSGLRFDFGVRDGERTATNTNFNMIAPVFGGSGASDAAGCYVRWKAADVVLNGGGIPGACSAGNTEGFFRAGVISAQNPSQLPAIIRDNMALYNIGGVSMYNLNPKAMKDPLAFQEALYPGEVQNVDPGGTWRVALNQTTSYLKADFAGEAIFPYGVNAGARVVSTRLDVTQHAVGNSQPYGVLAADNGTVLTNRKFTDVLPAVNFFTDFTERLRLRLAYSKNMQVLNLDQWGGGLSLNYGIDNSTPGSTLFRVLGGNSNGNPDLDPWRSTNYDASLEFYVNRSTMLNFALFYIDVESFINNGSVQRCDLPDQDGVVRDRCVSVTGPIQGEGAALKGAEFGIKQAFDFLPGFWSNFGTEVNLTYSPSDTGRDLAGNKIPFQDNSSKQANAILWYQNSRFQTRVAGNYRSKRAVSENFGGITGLEEYQKPTFYLDASAAYDFTPNAQAYIQASNLLNEHERYYLVWDNQVARTNQFERRIFVGVRTRLGSNAR